MKYFSQTNPKLLAFPVVLKVILATRMLIVVPLEAALR